MVLENQECLLLSKCLLLCMPAIHHAIRIMSWKESQITSFAKVSSSKAMLLCCYKSRMCFTLDHATPSSYSCCHDTLRIERKPNQLLEKKMRAPEARKVPSYYQTRMCYRFDRATLPLHNPLNTKWKANQKGESSWGNEHSRCQSIVCFTFNFD